LTNMLTVYALFATPFVLVFEKFSDDLKSFELFVDVCFTLDIIMNFFKLNEGQKESELKKVRIEYIKSGIFFIDCIAALPGLITLESAGVNFFKLARFVHWSRFFDQLQFVIEKIFMTWLNYTKQKVTENVDFIKL
jgi:hypothetical protein